MTKMDVLVTHELSQAVANEYRKRGHNAFSCDIEDCEGGHPEYHIKGDAIAAIKSRPWDLIISFPPCTDLSASGSGSYAKKRANGAQEASITHFLDVWELAHCVENPRNIMSGWGYIERHFPHIIDRMIAIGFPRSYQQSIQPWQFGHGETKETWLWLNGLPRLYSTNVVPGREPRVHRMGPSKNRAKLRSMTYPGVAAAMADQWDLTPIKRSLL